MKSSLKRNTNAQSLSLFRLLKDKVRSITNNNILFFWVEEAVVWNLIYIIQENLFSGALYSFIFNSMV